MIKLLQALWPNKRKELPVENNTQFVYTDEQLMARLKFFIGICLALTLTGIVFVVLYSIIFVTQPLNAISPIDQKFFELIIPIATFLTGTLSGIMLSGASKEDKEAMLAAQKQAQSTFESFKSPPPPPPPPAPAPSFGAPSTMGFGGSATTQPQVIAGFGGKLGPPPAPQPEI